MRRTVETVVLTLASAALLLVFFGAIGVLAIGTRPAGTTPTTITRVVIVPTPPTTTVGRTVLCTNADGWKFRTTPALAARNHFTHCQETP